MNKKKTVILGAGLVGSLLSILLRKEGYEISLYEKRGDPRRKNLDAGKSINLALSHRGFLALEKAGIQDLVKPLLVKMEGRMIHQPGGNIDFQPYGQNGQAIYSVSRNVLNKLLIDQAEKAGVNIFFNHYCAEIDLKQHQLTFDHESDFVKFKAERVIGADGAYSILRQTIMKTRPLNFSQEYLDYGYKEFNIDPDENGNFRMDPNGLHIWPRKNFMLIALPNSDRSFTVTLFLAMEGAESFDKLEENEGIARRFFEKYFPDALELMNNFEGQWNEHPTSALVTIKCEPWQHDGRYLLIGDAAHAILPFYGQGMNAGFEDCRVLLEMLEEEDHNWEKMLPEFEAERKPNADAIAQLARDNFIEMRDRVADPNFLKQKRIEARLHKEYPEVWMPLYSMVTFSNLPYSEAYQRGRIQQEIMKKTILDDPDPDQVDLEKIIRIYQANII